MSVVLGLEPGCTVAVLSARSASEPWIATIVDRVGPALALQVVAGEPALGPAVLATNAAGLPPTTEVEVVSEDGGLRALPAGRDARRYVRFAVSVPMMVGVPDFASMRFESITARVLDIAGGGAKVLSARPMTVGEQVAVAFHLPPELNVHAHAEVLGSTPGRVGGHQVRLAFRSLAASEQAAVTQALLDLEADGRAKRA